VRFVLVVAACAVIACGSSGKREDGAVMTPAPDPKPTAPTAQPRIVIATPAGDVAVAAEVVATPSRITRGLMYREHLPPDAGMLFVMGSEEDHHFWMHNTLISLDMIFIARDKTIAGIVERAVPRSDDHRSVGAPSLWVLEVNGGWCAAHGVKTGARVRFEHVE
jgi:uncharacterized membrane protein (UPF0127 family)